MRGLFILLLLSNLVYLALQYVNGTSDTELDPYRGVQMEKKGLTLLSELPSDKRPPLRDGIEPDPDLAPWAEQEQTDVATAAVIEETGDSKTTVQCLRVSGIRSEEQLQILRKSLQELGVDAVETGSESASVKADIKYWVMLPPYPSLTKATETAAALQAVKIKDFFVVRNGEYENAVSLGVFSTRERAERRKAQIAELKDGQWQAKIEEIGSATEGEYFWLSFRQGEEVNPTRIRAALRKQGLSQLKEIECK